MRSLLCIIAFTGLTPGVVMARTVTADAGPGEACMVCVSSVLEDENGGSFTVHRFSGPAGEGAGRECKGPGGHPVHNCDTGDDLGWFTYGDCSVHATCGGQSLAAALQTEPPLDPLSSRFADVISSSFATYDAKRSEVVVRNCAGAVAGVFKVVSTA